MKNKVLIAFITSAILSIFAVTCSATTDFPDMKNHWASESVNVLTDLDVINGWEDGLFHPNDYVKANEYIKMVVTALGHTDIQNHPGDWARNYIEKAVELGLIFEGEIENYDEPINRSMMAKIAMRALQDEYTPDYIMAYKGLVSDYNDLDANIRLDALKCIEKGIIKGMPDGAFRPEYLSTRAEAATVIHRMISEEEREKSKPIFAESDPEFETFMASEEAVDYCSTDLIYKVVDGKVIFGGELSGYQDYGDYKLLPTAYNPEANKEAYETLRNLIMYARENNHFVRVFLTRNDANVFIYYYENNRFPKGPNWSETDNFSLYMRLTPNKYAEEAEEYTYYTWEINNLAMQTTEDWASVNYRDPEMTKAVEIALKSIYGEVLGQKFLDFAMQEYDNERENWFVHGRKDYSNFFLEYREDLGGLEVYNNNGNVQIMTVRFCTNK